METYVLICSWFYKNIPWATEKKGEQYLKCANYRLVPVLRLKHQHLEGIGVIHGIWLRCGNQMSVWEGHPVETCGSHITEGHMCRNGVLGFFVLTLSDRISFSGWKGSRNQVTKKGHFSNQSWPTRTIAVAGRCSESIVGKQILASWGRWAMSVPKSAGQDHIAFSSP